MAKAKKKQPLTDKQLRFAEEYLVDLNATAAYARAGYAAKGHAATVNAQRLLTNADVQAAITAGNQKRSQDTGITAARVLQELALIAFSDVGEVLDFTGGEPRLRPASEIPEAARRAISSVKVKRYLEGKGDDARDVEVTEFKFWSKDAALDKLGKHLALFLDRHEHSGPGGKPIPVSIIEVVKPSHDE